MVLVLVLPPVQVERMFNPGAKLTRNKERRQGQLERTRPKFMAAWKGWRKLTYQHTFHGWRSMLARQTKWRHRQLQPSPQRQGSSHRHPCCRFRRRPDVNPRKEVIVRSRVHSLRYHDKPKLRTYGEVKTGINSGVDGFVKRRRLASSKRHRCDGALVRGLAGGDDFSGCKRGSLGSSLSGIENTVYTRAANQAI